MDQLVGLDRSVKAEGFSFEEMRLQVGARLQLQVNAGVNSAHYVTTLIGFVKDEYLIVRVPFENGLSVALPQEATVVIRALAGVHVFAFSCVVLRIFLSPMFYMHLSFPSKISGALVREALRAAVDVPVEVSGADGVTVTARFTNLSATGGFIEAATKVGQRDETLRFAFSIRIQPGNREVKIETAGSIRNVRAGAEESKGKFGYGVRFENLGEHQEVLIQNLVYQALTESRGS